MIHFWNKKKVLVTGGLGFIGSHLVEKLIAQKAQVTILDHIKPYKLENITSVTNKVRIIEGDCNSLEDAQKAAEGQDIVMNLAAHVGGIEYNRNHNGSMLRKNVEIASTVIEAARLQKVERFIVISSALYHLHACILAMQKFQHQNQKE
jgi:nucleoside-diphosphate-sugar epimerase